MKISQLSIAALAGFVGIQSSTAVAFAESSSLTTMEVVPFANNYGALFYYKTSNEAFDIDAAAANAREVQTAGPFDKQKQQAMEADRIRKALAEVNGDRLLTISVITSISTYDQARQEFSIGLFEEGKYIPFNAYGRDFHLIFENAEAYRVLMLSETEARKVNDQSFAKAVTVKVDFHLSGAGDPTGTSVSTNTVRALVTKIRILDNGKPLLPDIVSKNASAPAPLVQVKAANDWAVRGLHLGMAREAFEVEAKAAYASSAKFELGRDDACGGQFNLVTVLRVVPGSVCVIYVADAAGLVKQFSVKQITGDSPESKDGFRALLIDKFGAVAHRGKFGEFGWGELVGQQDGKNYTVYAIAYRAMTSDERIQASSGTPALEITITDPEFARSRLPKPPAAVAPKL